MFIARSMDARTFIDNWTALRRAIDAYTAKRRTIERGFMPGFDRAAFDGIDIDKTDPATADITIRWTDTVCGGSDRHEVTVPLADLLDESEAWFDRMIREKAEAEAKAADDAAERQRTAPARRRAAIIAEIEKLRAEAATLDG